MDLSKFKNGVYFIQIISDDKVYTEKLIIQ
ncbi:MAG: T9SS type A sorting domain-containing protein [Bacteroidales bacterium]|nr:T9SS type A sorting domain-containing protein [Bacteroidales bacterium]